MSGQMASMNVQSRVRKLINRQMILRLLSGPAISNIVVVCMNRKNHSSAFEQ